MAMPLGIRSMLNLAFRMPKSIRIINSVYGFLIRPGLMFPSTKSTSNRKPLIKCFLHQPVLNLEHQEKMPNQKRISQIKNKAFNVQTETY